MLATKAKFSFAGGVHPEYHKELTADLPIEHLPMPKTLTIALSQHLGAPALPIVKVGDLVAGGQMIAEANGVISAPIHAPCPAKVVALGETLTASGRPCGTIVLEPQAEGEWQFLPTISDWRYRRKKDLINHIGTAGIVGMGGAGFPTRTKLSPPSDKPIDTLILNGAECEPYLTADHRMMVSHATEICLGAEIIRHILGATTLRVTIEDNKPAAIEAMTQALKELEGDVAVTILPTVYPQGSEKQQIYSVTGREIPRGGLPMDAGCVVENVSTAFAIYEAVIKGRSLVRRVITVTGDAITRPANLLVPLGATYADLIAACGGIKGKAAKIVAGGPMMGFTVGALDITTSKTSSGLLLLSKQKVFTFTDHPCIACGRCIDACPMRLSPAELSQHIEADDVDGAEELALLDCIECGCCAFACPARRPLVQHIRRGKAVVMAQRAVAHARK